MRLLLLGVALALAALPVAVRGDVNPSPVPVPPGGVVIVSPPTGDLAGYRIVIAPSGDAVAVDGAGRAQRALPPSVVKTLFGDLEAAMPLSKLPASACVRSSKTPTPLLVSYRGETSPDLTCAADAKQVALYSDAEAIVHTLYVANYRSRAVSHYSGSNPSGNSSVPAAQPAPPDPYPQGMGGY